MTTYILVGGNDLRSDAYGQTLTTFVGSALGRDNPTILSCFFARSDDEKQAALPYWSAWFVQFFPKATVIDADPEKFYEQVEQVDIIYLHGGNGNGLFDVLNDGAAFEQAVTGKIVIGSSAGAHYLSSAFYRRSQDIVRKGTGIVPLPVLVHYGVTEWQDDVFEPNFWSKALTKIQQEAGSDTVLCLPEGSFAIFQK